MSKIVGFCVAALLSIAPVWAGSIEVTNFSFETLPSGGLPNSCPDIGPDCHYNLVTAYSNDYGTIPGWYGTYSTAYYIGQFHPGTPSSDYVELSDGPTQALTTGTIYQTVGATVQSGVIYTLLVDLGGNTRFPRYGSADLLVNGHTYAATGSGPVPGYWSTFTTVYTGSDTDVGAAITIELSAAERSYGQPDPIAFFDNVRLSSAYPTPEPASTGIVAIGLMGLLVLARRRAA